jgi:hypothetical protein
VNVFVLCTGRSGSLTFSRAAAHITNFTVAHESKAKLVGDARIAYPPNHIEVDNRLTWILGRLGECFGDDAFYVHLTRNSEATARSFNERWNMKEGIIAAYRDGILMGAEADPMAVCADYVETVNSNIRAFLENKSHTMSFEVEHAQQHWPIFWRKIGAKGDMQAALNEWNTAHNAHVQQPSVLRRYLWPEKLSSSIRRQLQQAGPRSSLRH